MIRKTVHLCLLRAFLLPVEIRTLIAKFSFADIRNETIKTAALLSNTIEGQIKYGPIEWWDTSQVTNMDDLFFYNTSFNSDISRWDVSNVFSMNCMFEGAESFNQPIQDWNVKNLQRHFGMFRFAKSFNQPINKWKIETCLLTNIFWGATSFNQPLDQWTNLLHKIMYAT